MLKMKMSYIEHAFSRVQRSWRAWACFMVKHSTDIYLYIVGCLCNKVLDNHAALWPAIYFLICSKVQRGWVWGDNLYQKRACHDNYIHLMVKLLVVTCICYIMICAYLAIQTLLDQYRVVDCVCIVGQLACLLPRWIVHLYVKSLYSGIH